jgi:hypothetical protein
MPPVTDDEDDVQHPYELLVVSVFEGETREDQVLTTRSDDQSEEIEITVTPDPEGYAKQWRAELEEKSRTGLQKYIKNPKLTGATIAGAAVGAAAKAVKLNFVGQSMTAIAIAKTTYVISQLEGLVSRRELSAPALEDAEYIISKKRQKRGKAIIKILPIPIPIPGVGTGTTVKGFGVLKALYKLYEGKKGKHREEVATRILNGLKGLPGGPENQSYLKVAMALFSNQPPSKQYELVHALRGIDQEMAVAVLKGKMAST